MTGRMKGLLAAAVCYAALANAAFAATIIATSGSTNPATNGFNLGGSGYSAVTTGTYAPAVNMTGPWASTQFAYDFTTAQVTTLTTGDWVLTADVADLSTSTSAQTGLTYSYGDYVSIILNNTRFDLELVPSGSPAGTNQLLVTNVLGTNNTYTITGAGSAYVLLQLNYIAATHTANYYVNGVEVGSISNFAGTSQTATSQILFGGVNGDYSLVQLATGDVQQTGGTTPEPASWLGAGAGLLALAALASFRANRTVKTQ